MNFEQKRFKDLIKLKSGDLVDKSKSEGVYPIYGANGIIGSINKKNIKNSTLLIGRVGSAGAINIASEGFASDNALIVKVKNNNSVMYIYYFLSIFNFSDIISKTSQPLLVSSKLLRSEIEIPPLEQQTAIANFLDIETSKIDKKIELLSQKMEKLEEYKQSVIFETVTKGLDNSVPMKDSGINWIGDIPAHWEVKRIKDVLEVKKGNQFDESWDSVEGLYPYVNGGVNPSGWSNKVNTKKNTIAVSEGGASAGFVQFMQTDYWAGSHCYKIKSQNYKMDNKYFYYLLKGFEQFLKFEKTGSAMPNLQKSKFINYVIIFTNNIDEQNKIIYFLDNKISQINRKIDIINKQVELLKEYKQSFIYEAVTGKFTIGEKNEYK